MPLSCSSGIGNHVGMITEIIDLAFPSVCLACGKKPKPLCQGCTPVFSISREQGGLIYAAELDDAMLAILAHLKDKNRTSLIKPLAKGVAPGLQLAIEQTRPTLLVCPPSSKKNFRKRGFNPAKEIFRLAKPNSLMLTDRALGFVSQPKDQRLLRAAERLENAQNRYRCRITGERVLLVDDVMTTGATLASAANAIEDSGNQVVGKCVVARRFGFSSHGFEK